MEKNIHHNEITAKSALNQYISVIICCFLPFLYGNSIGWSSTAVPQLEKGGSDLPSGIDGIDTFTSGWVGGAFCIGALISSPFHGILADAKGRKFTGYAVAIAFLFQWILIGFGNNMIWVFIGRGFGGYGGAGSITVASIYSNEVAEKKNRGKMGSFLALLYVSGIFAAFVLGAYIPFKILIYTYIGMCILFLIIWWKMPETPAYLVLQGRDEEALKTLMWLRNSSKNEAEGLLLDLKLQQEGAVNAVSLLEFFKIKVARHGLFLNGGLVAFQTFSGMFAINSYASNIFARAGGILEPYKSTFIYGAVMCIGCLIPIFLVEKFGRKILLVLSCALEAICMITMGTYFYVLKNDLVSEDNVFFTLVPLLTLSGCVFVYYIGLGSVPYVLAAECFADETRGIGGAGIAAIIWVTSFFLLQFFNSAIQVLGDYTVFYFFGLVCTIASAFVYYYFPETKGKTQSEIIMELMKKA